MKDEMLSFVSENRVGVLATQLCDDSPHAATVHFAHLDDPFSIIVLTERDYKKCEALIEKGKTKGSFVVGTSEDNMKTLQIDGIIKLNDNEEIQNAYFAKFSDKKINYEAPDDVFLVLTPTWWRYTDWTKPEGKVSFDSDGNLVKYD